MLFLYRLYFNCINNHIIYHYICIIYQHSICLYYTYICIILILTNFISIINHPYFYIYSICSILLYYLSFISFQFMSLSTFQLHIVLRTLFHLHLFYFISYLSSFLFVLGVVICFIYLKPLKFINSDNKTSNFKIRF